MSFAKRKVNDYVSTWDDEMPWGIDHLEMNAAATRALAMPGGDRGIELGLRAHENIQAVVEHVREWAASGAPPDRMDHIVGVRNQQWSRLTIDLARAEAARKSAEAARNAAAANTAPRGAVKSAPRSKTSLLKRARRRAGRIVRRVQRAVLRD